MGPEPFSLNIVTRAVGGDHFAEQDGAAITQLRVVAAKLVTGIHRCHWLRAVGYTIAGNRLYAFR